MARVSVLINDESAEALAEVMRDRGISATEATRRAVWLLGFVEEARRSGKQFFAQDTEGEVSILRLL